MPTRRPAPVRSPRSTALAGVVALSGSIVGSALLLVAVVGCHDSEEVSGGPKPTGEYKAQGVSSAQVAVGAPVAVVKDGVLTISGDVHRLPGVTDRLDGRVDVDLIGPDGLQLDKSLRCHLEPPTVPMDPNHASIYAPTPFGYVPPAGSTLRARYVDHQAAILEDLKDGDLDYNGNYGHTGMGVSPTQENGSAPARAQRRRRHGRPLTGGRRPGPKSPPIAAGPAGIPSA